MNPTDFPENLDSYKQSMEKTRDLLEEQRSRYETLLSHQREEIHEYIRKEKANQNKLVDVTQDYSSKLDLATSRILELETILSVIKLESEERLKTNSKLASVFVEEQVRLKDMLLSLSSQVAIDNEAIRGLISSISSCGTRIEGALYELVQIQNKSSMLPQETADLFTTINTLNNTIKALKYKSSQRTKKLTESCSISEEKEALARESYQNISLKYENLQSDMDIAKSQLKFFSSKNEKLENEIATKEALYQQVKSECEVELSRQRSMEETFKRQSQLAQDELENLRRLYERAMEQLLHGDHIEYKERVEFLTKESDELKRKIINNEHEYMGELQQKNATISSLEKEKAVSQKRISEMESAYEESLLKLRDISNNDSIKSSELKKLIYQKEEECKSLHKEMKTLQEQLQVLTKRYIELEQIADSFRLKNEVILAESKQRERIHIESSQRYDDEITKLKSDILESQKQLEAKAVKLKAAIYRKNEYEKINGELRHDLELSHREVQHMKQSMRDSEALYKKSLLTLSEQCQSLEHAYSMQMKTMEMSIDHKLLQLRSLSCWIANISQHVSNQQNICQELQKSVLLFKKKNKEMNKLGDVKAQEIKSLSSTVQSLDETLRTSVQEYEEKLSHLTREIKDLSEERVARSLELRETLHELSTTKNKLNETSEMLATAEEKLRGLEDSHSGALSMITIKSSKCDSLTDELRSMKDRMMGISIENDRLREEIIVCNDKILELKFSGDHASSQIKSLESLALKYKTELKALEIEKTTAICNRDDLAIEKLKIDTAMESCREDIKTLQAELRNKDQETLRLNEYLARLQAEFHQDKAAYESKEQETADLIHRLSKEKEEYTAKCESFEEEIEDKLDIIDDQERTIEDLREQIAKLKDDLFTYKFQFAQQEEEVSVAVQKFQEELFSLQSQIAGIQEFDLGDAASSES